MSISTKPALHTPTLLKGEDTPASRNTSQNSGRQNFVALALTMSWQLALVVLVPVIGGVQLDKAFSTKNVYTFAGLAVALALSGVVMWRAMQTANSLPVPKLTPAQKKAVQKQYEEEDNER